MNETAVAWLHEWPPSGPTVLRLGRAGDVLIAEWPGMATMRTNLAGTLRELTFENLSAAPHLEERLNEVLDAFVRHLRGEITLHAASVCRDETAIACIGESSAGKSTLAARLCNDCDATLLADDTTALVLGQERIDVAPTEHHHWLRADVAREMGFDPLQHAKVAIAAARRPSGHARLAAIVSLVFDDERGKPDLRRLRGTRSFEVLNQSTFRMAIDVPEVLTRELDNLARIAAEVPVFELSRSRDPHSMDACYPIVDQLLRTLAGGGQLP